MAEFVDREHYIPLRKSDLIDLLLHDSRLETPERQPFTRFCQIVTSTFHLQYLQELETFKNYYAPFDPDSETKPLRISDAESQEKDLAGLFNRFESLMQRANFRKLSWAEVEAAMEGGASNWGVNLHIDPKIFERIDLYSRQDVVSERTHGWFRKKVHKIDCWQRLILIIKLRPHRRLRKTIDTKNVYIKIFKDIPKLDLEMLLPGGRLKWPTMKKLTFWGLMTANIGYLLFSLSAKLLAIGFTLAAGIKLAQEDFVKAWSYFTSAAVIGPIAILTGFSYRQYSSYQSTKQNYVLMLTESLYYQNLDNNLGVFTRLVDEAEEQECREVLLAYYMLWKYAPPSGWDINQLDDHVEAYLEKNANLHVDFEIEDALAKLETIGLVKKTGTTYRAVSLAQATALLQTRCQEFLGSSPQNL